jgi:hypothetical protein
MRGSATSMFMCISYAWVFCFGMHEHTANAAMFQAAAGDARQRCVRLAVGTQDDCWR